jgi:hypothetical protein
MPSPINEPLGTPRNTRGDKIPVGVQYLGSPNIPIYWGDNQILQADGTYTKPTLPPHAPLHIPRVVRFLYAYPVPFTPPELNAQTCGCTGVTHCPDIHCSWVQSPPDQLYTRVGYRLQQVFYDNAYKWNTSLYNPSLNSGIGPSVGTSTSSWIYARPQEYGENTHFRVWSRDVDPVTTDPDVYDGPLFGCGIVDHIYLNRRQWNKQCTRISTGLPVTITGCPDTYIINWVTIGSPGGSSCSMAGRSVNFIFFSDTDWLAVFTMSGVDSNFSSYPPPSSYSGGCVDEASPC